MNIAKRGRLIVFLGTVLAAANVYAGPAVKVEEGKYLDKDGNPTYNKKEDGTWDWYTFSGFRRYHSECHVCHGPEAAGSTYAPALADSLKTMTYDQFVETVVNGRTVHTAEKESVMPALGTNRNVMCYLDDIYVYIKARADGAIPRGERPEKHETKLDSIRTAENQCMGF
ncbi:c-type cytochrome, methanol metabolism-related [Methyloraptor flagellatus]|jgi:methanol metabolism-related c-type cytochrome|uniref:C-type cytochrome, methanol metabolism-related n=1 Tax=Methyloraptor flagellatus TaxID=3162530 RepID=A0AAU7XB82_9HYPH